MAAKKKANRMSEDEIISMMVERMERAHWDPAFIYAFRKTGMLVSAGNLHLFSKKDLKRWDAAVAEYRREHSND